MDNMLGFLDFIAIGAGLYMIYVAVQMKRTGKVTDNGLISKGLELDKAPDMKSYIEIMYKWNIFLGILLVLNGAISFYSSSVKQIIVIQSISTVITVVLLAIYGVVSMKAQNKYLKP